MRQAAIFTAVGLLAGIALASWFGRGPMPTLDADADRSDASFATAVTSDHEIAARLTELERRLAAEAERRVALEATVADLTERLGPNGMLPLMADATSSPQAGSVPGEAPDPRRIFAARRAMIEQRNSPEFRRDRLVEAGFTADEAQALLDRESQMRLELMNASYEARREGGQVDPQVDRQRQRELETQLRSELGEDKYERYLEATGQPTRVSIAEVLSNSAGEIAGLQPGDEIVGYDGQRVFNLFDLRAQTISGAPGETVPLDIVRDGQPMQLYIQRGPLGITGGGFFRGPAGTVFGAVEAMPPP